MPESSRAHKGVTLRHQVSSLRILANSRDNTRPVALNDLGPEAALALSISIPHGVQNLTDATDAPEPVSDLADAVDPVEKDGTMGGGGLSSSATHTVSSTAMQEPTGP